MSSPRQRRRRPRIPRGGRPAGLRDIERIMDDVDVDVAALLSDDPALGMQPLRGTGGNQPPLPVALFELRESAMASHPDGSIQELQVEAIIQTGFSRWRSVVTFEELPD
jgi:hypothetical protein